MKAEQTHNSSCGANAEGEEGRTALGRDDGGSDKFSEVVARDYSCSACKGVPSTHTF